MARSQSTSSVWLVVRLSLILLVAVVLGLGLGYIIDEQAGTKPLFMLVLSLFGIIFGSVLGFRATIAAMADAERRVTAAGDRQDGPVEPRETKE